MPTQLDQLLELLDGQAASVRRAFLEFVRLVRSDYVLAELIDLLQSGDMRGATALVDSYVARFANVIPEIIRTVGIATSAELEAALPEVVAAIAFDSTFPRAAELAASSRIRLIREFSVQQQRATQQAIARAVREGRGVGDMARAFRESIGLTAEQEQHLANYRLRLETLDRRALDSALRDRRMDSAFERAIQLRRPLTRRQVDNMVMRRRANAIMMRAETISRTEALTAYSQAREESLQQMMDQTGITSDRVNRIWHATHDKRVRNFHLSMDGQRRHVGEWFEDGHGNAVRYPGDPESAAETRINCRCTLGFEVLPAR